MKMLKYYFLLTVLTVMPAVASAQRSDFNEINNFVDDIIAFINNTVVPLIFILAFVFFIWGVFRYFIAGGDKEDNHKIGKKMVIYSIVGFVLMISIWGIVNIIGAGLGLDKDFKSNLIPDSPSRR